MNLLAAFYLQFLANKLINYIYSRLVYIVPTKKIDNDSYYSYYLYKVFMQIVMTFFIIF